MVDSESNLTVAFTDGGYVVSDNSLDLWAFFLDTSNPTGSNIEDDLTQENLQSMVEIFLVNGINDEAFFHKSNSNGAALAGMSFTKAFDQMGSSVTSVVDATKS